MPARVMALLVLLWAPAAFATGHSTMAQLERYFRSAIEVDALHVQISLLEAGLYHGQVDGRWGAQTEDAFRDALDWMVSRGAPPDLRTEAGFYEFVEMVRHALFDIDSGLSRTPTGPEFVMVTAGRRSQAEADQLAGQLERRLSARGYPSRAQVLLASNGVFAVTAGMYSRAGCMDRLESFRREGLVPSDSYCAGLERFDPFNWTN
jgi:hypothetical protein